jgi:transcriptional regulator with XRE-family HTH domain
MESAATLLYHARDTAGLSRRALARRAGVPISTVSRVEDGEVDPTITMLQRMLAAAGRQMSLELEPIPKRRALAALADAWSASPTDAKINWTRLRAFLDWLRAHPNEVEAAISTPPPRSGNKQLDALLAAIAEKVADDAGLTRPRWCAAIPALSSPWRPPGTPRMIEAARRNAPPQFKARNIWLAARDLWRNHD